ncbi:MAG TPA: nuclear transport factor 2 family protein [Candidatus Baltobacteraceae bacterium]|jgi:SnoaL-like domain|nr:nuclear transport factor 2 family protein [Candidatus Baltobacteraceae bacterium]
MKTKPMLIVFALLVLVVAGVALASGAGEKNDRASEIELLKTQVAALQTQATAAQDYVALANLQAIYGYYVDKCKWDQVADLFAKDGTLEIGLRGVWVGQDRVRAYLHTLPDLKYGTLFNHVQLQPVINIAPDGKTAKARWRAFEQFGMLHRAAQWGGGVYENEYVKEDGVWKISKLHYYMNYYVDYYKGWDQGGLPAPPPIKGFPPDRPTTVNYKLYPDVFVPPYHYNNPVTGK